jgi:DNA repair exonuclease SbcCD ATPase subunit
MQLLQFAEPIEKQKVIYFDRRPESSRPQNNNNHFPKKIFDKNSNKNKTEIGIKKYATYNKKTNNKNDNFIYSNRNPPIEAKQTIIKSIMFPNDEKEINFDEEKRCLNKHKEELKELYENMILKLNEEDKLRDEEIRLQNINMNKNLENLNKKNNSLKKSNYSMIKKFMDLKYDTNNNSQKVKDEIEMTKLQGEALQGSINELKKKSKIDKEMNKKDFARRTRQVANTLRTQVKTKEETANLAMKQFNDIQQIYEDKINEAKNKYKNTENKYLLLKDGYFNEEENQKKLKEVEQNIRLFRAKMKEFEEYINDIKKMTRGDYDHYDEIQRMTSDKNEQFLRESEIVDEQLKEFEIILSERQKENNQILKDINEHFDENGMFLVNKTDNKDKIRDDIKNKIVEEDEEKQPDLI